MTTKSVTNILEDVLIGLGVSISLIDLRNILSIILLVIDVIWLIVKCGYSIYKNIKNRNYDGVKEDVNELKDGIEKIKDSIDDKSKGS